MRRGPGRRAGRRAARRTTHRVMRRTRRRFIRRTVLVGGMVVIAAAGTAAAIKLSQKDAQRIEEHTGLPPQDLEDEDLTQAMQELNIQSQPVTPEDEAALAQQEGTQAVAPAAQASAAPSSGGESDYIAELEKLADLRDRGIITSEEFEAKKKQLLGL
jgi:predicted PhzF superfamily epimerase YddE/YHI9